MTGEHRSIFRADAVRRYIQSQQRTTLPRLVRPRIFLYLWFLLGLLLLVVGLIGWRASSSLSKEKSIFQPTVTALLVGGSSTESSVAQAEAEGR